MIPERIEAHLDRCHGGYEHHLHDRSPGAQRLAHVEHVSGFLVAKVIVVRVGGEAALAVVAAPHRLDVRALEISTGKRIDVVPEREFVSWFSPCEPGAEPPLAIFGLPIYADAALTLTDRVLMPAGTFDDSVLVDTSGWVDCEDVKTIVGLGIPSA